MCWLKNPCERAEARELPGEQADSATSRGDTTGPKSDQDAAMFPEEGDIGSMRRKCGRK
jgi:hypothetical protein